jgi:hypothetical protein
MCKLQILFSDTIGIDGKNGTYLKKGLLTSLVYKKLSDIGTKHEYVLKKKFFCYRPIYQEGLFMICV